MCGRLFGLSFFYKYFIPKGIFQIILSKNRGKTAKTAIKLFSESDHQVSEAFYQVSESVHQVSEAFYQVTESDHQV
jgi:hypothetical protein